MLVTDVSEQPAVGAFNFHTLNGNVVVNGVVATHFTHATYDMLYTSKAMLPVWYKVSFHHCTGGIRL